MNTIAANVQALVSASGLPEWEYAFAQGLNFRRLNDALRHGLTPADFIREVEKAEGLHAGALKGAPPKASKAKAPNPLAARVGAIIDLYGSGRVTFARSAHVAPDTLKAILAGDSDSRPAIRRLATYAGLNVQHFSPGAPFPYDNAIRSFSGEPHQRRAAIESRLVEIEADLDSIHAAAESLKQKMRALRASL